MIQIPAAMWTDLEETQTVDPSAEPRIAEAALPPPSPTPLAEVPPASRLESPVQLLFRHGWPVPSTISPQPDEARGCIHLPAFDALVLERAQVISEHFQLAESEFRSARGKERSPGETEIPHFEKVFRIAAAM